MDEKKLIATEKNKDIGRIKKVNENIQMNYATIKTFVNLKHDADDNERKETVQRVTNECNDFFQSLGIDNPVMAMLAAQMDAVHDLQQHYFFLAKRNLLPEVSQPYTNTVIKLSNTFIQQAALMQKMQGKNEQRVTVEHVHLHDNAQAIIGNVSKGRGEDALK